MGVTPEPVAGPRGPGPGVPDLDVRLAVGAARRMNWAGSGALQRWIQVMNQLVHDASN